MSVFGDKLKVILNHGLAAGTSGGATKMSPARDNGNWVVTSA
jgi:hypothetical protein